jgi:ribonuclease HII
VEDNPKLMLYDIKKNKGYGTKNHLNALKIHGLSEFHRKTFGICKSL